MNKEKKILNYDESSMETALHAVKNGMSVFKASKEFKVPRTTLYYKYKGKYPEQRKMGRATYLTPREEDGLVKWVLHMKECGFPVTKDQLLESVQVILKKLPRETPFTEGKPGRHWYESFLKRHPQICERVSQNLTMNRANVTEENLKGWFDEVASYLKKNNYLDILEDEVRVFNMDETAFFLNPKGNKVLANKGDRTVYSKSGDEKECLTTLIGGNAAGSLVPPMIVFSYERIPSYLSESVPKNWGIGKSENGWMTGEAFFMYITNIFHPWLKMMRLPLPVILFVDGHTSHLTLHLSEFCNKNGIILVALYPNATHILQPMDVAVFRALKNCWKKDVAKWRVENSKAKLKKENFAPLLQKVLNKTITETIVANGFRACGLCPFNKFAINYERYIKCYPKKSNSEIEMQNCKLTENENETFIEQFNIAVGPEKLKLFIESGKEWTGPREDLSLFQLWCRFGRNQGGAENKCTVLKEDKRSEKFCEKCIKNHYATENNSLIDHRGEEVVNEANLLTPQQSDTIVKEANLPIPQQNDIQSVSISDSSFMLEAEWLDDLLNLECQNVEDIENFLIGKTIENEANSMSSHALTSQSEAGEVVMRIIEEIIKLVNEIIQEKAVYIEEKSPEVTKNIPEGVPTPFKSLLFWPEQSKNIDKKRKVKVRLPAVASSEQWQDFHRKSLEKKQEIERDKLERKRKREEKRVEKENNAPKLKKNDRLKKKDTNNEKNKEHENKEEKAQADKGYNQINEAKTFKKNTFVIVDYEGVYYPGKLEDRSSDEVYVSVMEKTGVNWRWPSKPDKLWYKKEDIVKSIPEPHLINKRGVYSVEAMKDFELFV